MTTTQQLEYTRTIVPNTMRSPYWKYFGFPGDDANNILTKQKIICTLCQTAIAYNKNTSNLRTHLLARHAELLNEVRIQQQQQPNGVGVPQKSASKRRRSLNYDDNDEDSDLLPTTSDAVGKSVTYLSKLIEDADDMEYVAFNAIEHDEAPSADNDDFNIIKDDAAAGLNANSQTREACYAFVAGSSSSNSTNYDKKSMTICGQKVNMDMLADALIIDLIPIDTLFGVGLKNLLQSTLCSVDKQMLNEYLGERYKNMENVISMHLQIFADQEKFSLCFEFYENIEKLEMCNIYFNYINTHSNNTFTNILCYSVNCKSVIDFNELFKNFNLINCAAIVTNNVDQVLLKDFAQTNSLPIVACLQGVLTHCLQRIFAVPVISNIFDSIHSALPSADVFLPCPWSKLDFLQSVLDNELLDGDDFISTLDELRYILDYINPFKILVETVAEESLPICTLIRPLFIKLFDEHFSMLNTEIKCLIEVKEIIELELTKSILNNLYLHEATFFDARFQHDFVNNKMEKHKRRQTLFVSRTKVQESICKRFKHILEIKTMLKPKLETDLINLQRKSGLKSFFTRISDASSAFAATGRVGSTPERKQKSLLLLAPQLQQQQQQTPPPKTNIELEFDAYKCEPILDLEQCPISWWQQHNNKYKQLQKIAFYYLCVPCCANNRFFRYSANERNTWLNKRFVLRQQQRQCINNADKYLWYLHYNKLFYDNLDVIK